MPLLNQVGVSAEGCIGAALPAPGLAEPLCVGWRGHSRKHQSREHSQEGLGKLTWRSRSCQGTEDTLLSPLTTLLPSCRPSVPQFQLPGGEASWVRGGRMGGVCSVPERRHTHTQSSIRQYESPQQTNGQKQRTMTGVRGVPGESSHALCGHRPAVLSQAS